MSITTDYRPDSFDEFYGNDEVIEALKAAVNGPRESMRRSYLFTGMPGTGKTTLARILKKELGVDDMEFNEYDTANTRGIDVIREIIERAQHYPGTGPFRMFLLDECHKITADGLNSLLKTLEEPPKHAIFILCTAEFDSIQPKLQQTIKRRCKHFEIQPMFPDTMRELLYGISEAEGKELSEKVCEKIVKDSRGSIGQALSFLDTVLHVENELAALSLIEAGISTEKAIIDICRALTNPQNVNPWSICQKALVGFTGEAEYARRQILGYLEKALLSQSTPKGYARIADKMGYFTDSFMYGGRPLLTLACAMACIDEDVPF